MNVQIATVVPTWKDAAKGHDAVGVGGLDTTAKAVGVLELVRARHPRVGCVRLLLVRSPSRPEPAVVALRVGVPDVDIDIWHRRLVAGSARAGENPQVKVHLD